jgi:hypothetical protein
LLQCLGVHDPDFSAGVFDEATALQGMGDGGHAGASHSEHRCQIFLGKRQRIAAGQVPGAQQPATKPRLHVMSGKARRRPLGLRVHRLLMADQQGEQLRALQRRRLQHIEVAYDGLAGKLYDAPT